jgi:ERCC4-type nuclease
MFKLIIDNREKYIIRHSDVLARIKNTQAQLTVGDYVITYRDDDTTPERVFAVFERKSLEDYAASMKDGRSDNKNKLLQLRDETGCKIFYIIEGDAFPTPTTTYARTPYYYIQSSIFHLQAEYDIQIIQTKNTLHTAETLVAFVRSMENLAESRGALFKTFHLAPRAIYGTGEQTAVDTVNTQTADTNDNLMAILTAPRPRTDNEILRSMWACFRYVSVESASEFMYAFTLADIFQGRVNSTTLSNHKTSIGRGLTKRVIESLLKQDSHRDIRILACVPGISDSKAKDILKQHSLRQLLSYSVGAISIIKVGISRKNLGESAAVNILKYFNMKPAIHGGEMKPEDTRVEVNAVAEATGEAAVVVDEQIPIIPTNESEVNIQQRPKLMRAPRKPKREIKSKQPMIPDDAPMMNPKPPKRQQKINTLQDYTKRVMPSQNTNSTKRVMPSQNTNSTKRVMMSDEI